MYSLIQGVKGLYRAKVSTLIAISVIFISLVLIGIFLITLFNVNRLIDFIHDRMELEAFIDNSYTDEQINQLRNTIEQIEGIKTVKYTSKEQAVEILKEQFGKDVFQILEENPLPSSFQLTLAKPFRSSENAKLFVEQLQNLDGIDEVVFRYDVLVTLDKYQKILFICMFSIGGLLALGSIFLVSNTIKLIILSRLQIIDTMKLVGATRGFIRKPFVVEGILQGTIGSVLAVGFFYVLLRLTRIEIPELIAINNELFIAVFGLGIFLGFCGSILAIQRFLRY